MDAIADSDPVTAARIGYVPRRPLPPSGVEPEQEKKVYCTYWIRTGECDYTQQGCLYKHEMPDLETLKKIGFISEPRWWKEKYAVKLGVAPSSTIICGPTWMQRRMNAIHSDDDADGESDAGSGPSKEEGIPASPEVSTPIPSAGPAPAVKQKPFVNWDSRKLGDIPVLHTFSSPSSSESSKSDITLTSLLSPHVAASQMTIENQRLMASAHALSGTTLQPPEFSVNASNLNTSSKDARLYQAQVHASRHQQKHPLNKDSGPVDALASNPQVVSVVRLENGSSSRSAVTAGHEKASHSKSQSGATLFSKRRFQSGDTGGAGSAFPPAK